ncbi:MAG: diphosphate--fructose-6-phosphate 1-phosphotransferase [Planctomycetaceae bacterium]
MRGNAIIGQSGGPTTVINASLVGVVRAAQKSEKIRQIFGMHFGIEGVLADDLIPLTDLSPKTLRGLRRTPSSALGSTRLKLQAEHLDAVVERFKQHDIRYVFMIGGNDTMDTIHRVVEHAAASGWEMRGIGIPKTVDNDLFGTDHTPGYPSAARYVALSVQQSGQLARDMQRVDQFVIFQTVGRSAGWLPAAAALARRQEGDAPHILLLPERPFQQDQFLEAVRNAHEKYGYVSIVCGEGITNGDGSPVSASTTRDKFNNVEFGAMGGASVGMVLHRILCQEFGWRGEFQVCESLQMCADDRTVKRDIREAAACGRRAVKLALKGTSGVMVTMQRTPDDKTSFGTIPLREVANHERPLPPEFIAESGLDITPAFVDYARPLLGPLSTYTRLF